jgi:hypothetical protein
MLMDTFQSHTNCKGFRLRCVLGFSTSTSQLQAPYAMFLLLAGAFGRLVCLPGL